MYPRLLSQKVQFTIFFIPELLFQIYCSPPFQLEKEVVWHRKIELGHKDWATNNRKAIFVL